jgi:hypothetical protein
VAIACFASTGTVDTALWAGTGERPVVGSTSAVDMVVACFVCSTAERADHGAFLDQALRNRVIKRMTSVAPAEDGEGNILFDLRHGSEKRWWVLDELLEVCTIMINKSNGDR